MDDDFDNLIDDDEIYKNSLSSIESVISVINDEGEEELIDLYQFYAEKTTRKKKTHNDGTNKDLGTKHILFQKRKEVSPPTDSQQSATVTDIETSDNKASGGEFTDLPSYYRDRHLRTALEIQTKIRERQVSTRN